MTDSIEREIHLNAPIGKVWAAIADHEQFGAWFRVALEGPFAVGEESRGHMTHPGYEHIRWTARTVAIDPPHRFAFTWHPYAIDPAVDYSNETPTLVEFLLESRDEGTQLIVRESGFDKVPAHRRDEALRMNGRGWTMQIENIRTHVDG